MIMLIFISVSGIFLISAHLSGDIGYFINIDSLLIVIAGALLSSAALSTGKFRYLIMGVAQMLSFSRNTEKNTEVKNIYTGLAILTIAVGVCSTAQGVISGILSVNSYSLPEIISIASFTTIYSIIISVFLFVPVILRNKE
jgi:flagellar motor component MotA